ncbi:hypothetical protein [uncultured Sphingomonas sp.]|uniref:hypothetical protein n=1 Tax=uncultured Sphingomonas sp. TaxID=158754 RepID=UPI0035CA6136
MTNETPAERREAAATRRRWVTLAEILAIAGVVIAALGLWSNWSDRRADNAEKAATQASQQRERIRFELKGQVASDGASVTLLRDDSHALGDVRVTFPTALGIAAKDAVDHRIDRDWFAAPLLKLTDGGADDAAGRLPVLVRYDYSVDDVKATRTALYDVVWQTSGRVLLGRSLKITDFRLREGRGDVARLDAAWAKVKPAVTKR